MASAALLKKRLHSIPLGRKTDPALRAAVTADDPTAFQAAFLAALAKPKKRLRKYLRQSSLLAAWSVDAVDLSGRERELAASLDDLSSRSAKQSRPQKKHKGKKLLINSDPNSQQVEKFGVRVTFFSNNYLFYIWSFDPHV